MPHAHPYVQSPPPFAVDYLSCAWPCRSRPCAQPLRPLEDADAEPVSTTSMLILMHEWHRVWIQQWRRSSIRSGLAGRRSTRMGTVVSMPTPDLFQLLMLADTTLICPTTLAANRAPHLPATDVNYNLTTYGAGVGRADAGAERVHG